MTPRGAIRTVAWVTFALVVAVGCGTTDQTGTRLGDLRTAARRVEGGGVECPIAFPPALLRPSSVERDAVVLPDRSDGHGSIGTIVDEHDATEDARVGDVTIVCTYKVGTLRVDIAIAGVSKGQAVSGMLPAIAHDAAVPVATLLPFAASSAELQPGQSMIVPGRGKVAFAKVESATGDVGLALAISSLDGKTPLPDDHEIEAMAAALAASLAR